MDKQQFPRETQRLVITDEVGKVFGDFNDFQELPFEKKRFLSKDLVIF